MFALICLLPALILFPLLVFPYADYLVDDLPILKETKCEYCYRVYVPVCGSDNRTYVNDCRMRCFNIHLPEQERPHIVEYGPCILLGRRSEWIDFNETYNFTSKDTIYFED